MANVSINDYAISLTNYEQKEPPCVIWSASNPSYIDVNCLNRVTPLQFELPSPNGITFPELESGLYETMSGLNLNLALQSLNIIRTAAFETPAGTITERLLSCKLTRGFGTYPIPSETLFTAHAGVNARMIQPLMVGCFIKEPFCPMFSNTNIRYRFWVSHPSGQRPSNYRVPGGRIDLMVAPGFQENENGTYLSKSSCNMDSLGKTCFDVSSYDLQRFGDDTGYGSNRRFPIWPLNVTARWRISGTTLSAFQTWLVIDYSTVQVPERIIKNCLQI